MPDSSQSARRTSRSAPAPQPPPPKGAVRLKDIANLAGVHVTAVSAVLSPGSKSKSRVSEEMAQRIRELAERLNYRPHLHARIMRRTKTGLIGLVEFARSEIHSTRTLQLARAISPTGYHTLISSVLWYDGESRESGISEAVDYILNARVEGAILIAPTAGMSAADAYKIQRAGIPCVGFNGVYFEGIPQVRSDAEGGMRALTLHLLKMGRRRLVLLGGWTTTRRDESSSWSVLERIRGFTSAIREAGGTLTEGLEEGGSLPATGIAGATVFSDPAGAPASEAQRGYDGMMRLNAAGVRPDALVCSNDRYALGAYRACCELGWKIPEEIAVTGFAGEEDMRFLTPSLTTVDTLEFTNAEKAVQQLLRQMKGETIESILKTPCPLVIRESCGAALEGGTD